eukprot:6193202-Pleurochrysis_carterae.AAC.1
MMRVRVADAPTRRRALLLSKKRAPLNGERSCTCSLLRGHQAELKQLKGRLRPSCRTRSNTTPSVASRTRADTPRGSRRSCPSKSWTSVPHAWSSRHR